MTLSKLAALDYGSVVQNIVNKRVETDATAQELAAQQVHTQGLTECQSQGITKGIENVSLCTSTNMEVDNAEDVKWKLATKYWVGTSTPCFITGKDGRVHKTDVLDTTMEAACGQVEDKPSPHVVPHVSTQFPMEDMQHIHCLSELSKVRRVITKFAMFRDIQDGQDVCVPLDNGETMRVHYKDIRYVESYLFRIKERTTRMQRLYKERQEEPVFTCVERYIPRLTWEERVIALCLLSQRRCENAILVMFLNLHLQQLTAFTFELIRRGSSMNAILNFHVDEYIDNMERNNIDSAILRLEQSGKDNAELIKFISQRWKKQREVVRVLGQKLVDLCIDDDSVTKRTLEDKDTKFYKKMSREISAVKCTLEPKFYSSDVYTTLCKLVHLVQLRETAYTMTTTTLRMAIQRRFDFLALIIMEHNMRAQHNQLSFGRNLYNLAQENTTLASELLGAQLYYSSQEFIYKVNPAFKPSLTDVAAPGAYAKRKI